MHASSNILLAAILTTSVSMADIVQAGGLLSAVKNTVAKRTAQTAPISAGKSVGKPRDVIIKRSQHLQAARHIEDAQRMGQPSVLHINRVGAANRRKASTSSVRLDRKPGPKYERDEYPPAMTSEGGHSANVRFIKRHDNRGAGASIRAQTRDLSNGSKIRVLVAD